MQVVNFIAMSMTFQLKKKHGYEAAICFRRINQRFGIDFGHRGTKLVFFCNISNCYGCFYKICLVYMNDVRGCALCANFRLMDLRSILVYNAKDSRKSNLEVN